jgi:ArsR family transcriptional regulator
MDRWIDGAAMSPDEAPACGHGHGAHPARPAAPMPAQALLEAGAAMLRAAGDPERLRLLMRLQAGELCVTELVAAEGEKMTTVSARLQQLRAARLVTRRRDARHVFYALADGHVARLIRDVLDHAAETRAPGDATGDRP